MPTLETHVLRLVSVVKAAAYADVHRETIYRRVADKTLTGYRLGGVLRVDLNELDAIMRGTDA